MTLKPLPPHTCHGNEHMPPGPCEACEIERAEYDALKAQSDAEQAQEAQDRHEFEQGLEP